MANADSPASKGRRRTAIETVSSPDSGLDFRQHNIGRLLLRCFRLFENTSLETILALGFEDIRPTHLTILVHIPPDGTRISEIAAEARMTKQAVAMVVQQLEDMGYLIRREDKDDGRSRIIQFSARGEELRDATLPILAKSEATMRAMIGKRSFDALKKNLEKLLE